jgi:hypothetical protein
METGNSILNFIAAKDKKQVQTKKIIIWRSKANK